MNNGIMEIIKSKTKMSEEQIKQAYENDTKIYEDAAKQINKILLDVVTHYTKNNKTALSLPSMIFVFKTLSNEINEKIETMVEACRGVYAMSEQDAAAINNEEGITKFLRKINDDVSRTMN